MFKLFSQQPNKQRFLFQMAEWLLSHKENGAAKKAVSEILKEDPSNKAARAFYAEIAWKQKAENPQNNEQEIPKI